MSDSLRISVSKDQLLLTNLLSSVSLFFSWFISKQIATPNRNMGKISLYSTLRYFLLHRHDSTFHILFLSFIQDNYWIKFKYLRSYGGTSHEASRRSSGFGGDCVNSRIPGSVALELSVGWELKSGWVSYTIGCALWALLAFS